MFRFYLVFLMLFILAPANSADWPQFLGPKRDGHSSEIGLKWDWAQNAPAVLWKRDIGQGWSGPVAVGDKVILFHRIDDQEIVGCFEAKTGKEIWSRASRTRYRDDFGFDEGPRATPLVADDRIFVLGANGDLRAIKLQSGEMIWERNILTDYSANKGFFGVASSPVLAGGNLLVNVGGKGASVVAFEVGSGKEIWKSGSDQASYSSPVVAEINGRSLSIFLTRAGLLALDSITGEERFRYPWRPRINESVNAATPLIDRDEIFITVSYGAGAVLLRVKNLELTEVWTGDRSLSCQYNTPVRVGDYLYGMHGRVDAKAVELRCVEWATGKVRWSRPGFGAAGLIVVDGGILALAESGDLIRFKAEPNGYKEVGRTTILSNPTRALPALANGKLFARDGSKLICVKLD